MDFIKQWTFCVCASLIIAVIFSVLTPKGTMNRFYKMMLSVFVFVSFLVPFQNFSAKDFDFSSIGIEDKIQLSQNKTAENMLESEISKLLDSNGIVGYSVSSAADYNASTGEIEINSVQISVSDDCDTKEIQKLVFESLGINAEVINVGN